MIVMVSNHTGIKTGYLAGLFPGKIGHLFSPRGKRGPYRFMPYGLDNDAFNLRDNWDEAAWLDLLEWASNSGQDPRWALVPDVVGDREETLARWGKYAGRTRHFGWPLAFAVQDGMTKDDVPSDAEVVFVGGSTEWKWATMEEWCYEFPRVHVGRVNSYSALWKCHLAGAESCDGTGWMRGCRKQYNGLLQYLSESSKPNSDGGFSLP
jgi:hypothetical protein